MRRLFRSLMRGAASVLRRLITSSPSTEYERIGFEAVYATAGQFRKNLAT